MAMIMELSKLPREIVHVILEVNFTNTRDTCYKLTGDSINQQQGPLLSKGSCTGPAARDQPKAITGKATWYNHHLNFIDFSISEWSFSQGS